MAKEKLNNTISENVPNVDASKFKLVHTDLSSKIHDQKLETKPTTFARDALRRFAKNKSSVVGAVIIGVLLLGSFLSFLSPHDIENAHADERLLPGKLFESNTGWWDGCTAYNDAPYDEENETPIDFVKDYCYGLTISGEKFSDQYQSYAKGGYLRITSDKAYSDPTKKISLAKYTTNTYNYHPITISPDDNFTLNIVFGNESNIGEGYDAIGEDILCEGFRIQLRCGNDYHNLFPTTTDEEQWSSDYSELNLNISEIMKEKGIAANDDCHIHIYGKPKVSEQKCYFLLKTLTMNSNVPEVQEVLNAVNISDANKTAGYGPDGLGKFPDGYWQSTSVKNVYHSVYKTASFRYDSYKATLGDIDNFVIGASVMNKYIENGWCVYPQFDDPSTFKVLDEEKCPVKKVYSHSTAGDVEQFVTLTTYYKYKGYSEMPKYIFGTDAKGHDLLTVALSSLKTSLLVAIISSAACLAIGLVWGSISGYFGGNVDIIMERFTDILGGVPWIVMMTLIILLLGNNVVTFAIALVMTGWIGTASRTRTQFYRFKGREYILASRTLGASDARLIFRHILPNGLGTIVTSSVLMIPSCIFSEASISYLGLGLQGVNSFGVLLSENQMYLSTKPLLILIPAIIISLLMISFNLFGNGLRDALNPTLKGGE